jgi:hypothetical protein
MEPCAKRRRPDRRTCPHCGKSLSFKSFKIHERLYYNPVDAVWIKSKAFGSSHEDTEFSSSDSEPSSVELNDLVEQTFASTPSPDDLDDTFEDSVDEESEPSSLEPCGECDLEYIKKRRLTFTSRLRVVSSRACHVTFYTVFVCSYA